MTVFVCLQADKEKSQRKRQEQSQFELAALIQLERPVSPGYRHTRSQQYERIDRRKTPRSHGHEFLS